MAMLVSEQGPHISMSEGMELGPLGASNQTHRSFGWCGLCQSAQTSRLQGSLLPKLAPAAGGSITVG